jgi:DNA adenine methylase
MKPFFKYPGGKSWLVSEFKSKIQDIPVSRYIEPFLGGGAILLSMLEKYPDIEYVVNDKNPVIYTVWKTLQTQVVSLIYAVQEIESRYKSSRNGKEFYLETRKRFNTDKDQLNQLFKITNDSDAAKHVETKEQLRALQLKVSTEFLFLNKTCFNGLYRENSKGEFNVPQGKYKMDRDLFDCGNMMDVSRGIQKVSFLYTGYEAVVEEYITKDSLIYCDPPYKSSAPTFSYHDVYGTADDVILSAKLVRICKQRGARAIFSNAYFPDYFKHLFPVEAGWEIETVHTKRRINSKASGRGDTLELLISNF